MKLLVILHFSIILTENRYFGSLVKSVKGGFILQYPPSITSLAVRGSLCASVCQSGASVPEAVEEGGCPALPTIFPLKTPAKLIFHLRFYFIYNIYTNLCHLSDK